MKYCFVFIFLQSLVFGQAWYRLADFPGSKRDDGVAVRVNQKLYVGTGLQEGWSATIDFFALDLENHQWSTIPTMPHTTERQYACAFPGPDCFFVFGGEGVGGALPNLYKYNILNSTWNAMAPKPGTGLMSSSCMNFGDKIIIVGGKINGSGPVSNEVWEYTISQNSWTKKSNFPFGGRWRSSAAVLNNNGYLLFGIDTNDVYRKEMYQYNPANDSWLKLSDFPSAKGRAYAGLVSTGQRLCLFGGVDSLGNFYKDVWYYNDLNGQWLNENNFQASPRKGGMMEVYGDQVYYVCGIDAQGRLNESWTSDVPLGITQQSLSVEFSVFPNPFKDTFSIVYNPETYGECVEAEVLDVFGKPVLEKQKVFWGNKLSIENFPSGLYILRVFGKENFLVLKKILKD